MADIEYTNTKQADNEHTYVEQQKGEIRISVRNLVEFILRQGDIDNRHQKGSDQAMQEGSRIHKKIQKQMGADYQAEVFLRYTHDTPKYCLIVEGRADGIIHRPNEVLVDEIKGTYRDLNKLHRPIPVHVAQAKCYAFIYGSQNDCKNIRIRMTYCNIETEDIRYFYEDYRLEELRKWFLLLIEEYLKWSDYSWEWKQIRQYSLENLKFPFPYREGQRDLVSYVYQTIYHQKKLFIEAPTGVGKTISTIFPAMKAMSKGMGDKLFYLTAKTITRTVADQTFALLREKQGVAFKSVILTAKEKICFMDHPECNPDSCPYAKGHYDRINDAVYDMLVHEDSYNRERIEYYAMKHRVCPFEMALDISLFADGIICDYNYLFDPHVYLKRFFAEGNSGSYLFLIDEAHNLLDRGREMYSAGLVKEDFLALKNSLKHTITDEIEDMIDGQMSLEFETGESLLMEKSGYHLLIEDNGQPVVTDTSEQFEMIVNPGKTTMNQRHKGKRRKSGKSILVKEGYAERLIHHLDVCNKILLQYKRNCESYRLVNEIDDFVNALLRLYSVMADYLEEQEETSPPVREELLDFYFAIAHFLDIYERQDENYVKYTELQQDGTFLFRLFCVNPRENLKECMVKGRSTILFSATLLPIQYYKELLGGDDSDYEVYAKSVFSPEKKELFIARDVTTRYTLRTQEQYANIARYIDEIVSARTGNYMVFFPSYMFMRQIYDVYSERFQKEEVECILQQEYMNEKEREDFLNRFNGNEECDLSAQINMEIEIEEEQRTLIGFCILGGIFGEGIDLKEDRLIGAIIVGTGLPQVGNEKEILKKYFDDRNENGFDYAYRFPGMNKVLQAAGRVIRTAQDIGIIALLDDRFLQFSYRRMFPREWESFDVVNVQNVSALVERFWDSWSKY